VSRIVVTNLDPRFQVFRLGRLVDAFAIFTERFTVFVDTMDSPEAVSEMWTLIQEFRSDLARPLVINTHSDWDHAWGNGFFDGPNAHVSAPIIGRSGNEADSQARLNDKRAEEPAVYESVEIRAPMLIPDGDLTIRGGDLTLEIFPTPGHTPDHVSVWVPEAAVLLTGDAAESPLPYVGERSSIPQFRQSLKKLRSVGARTVLYSHGHGLTTPDVLQRNIDYFDQAEARCREWVVSRGTENQPSPELLNWRLEDVVPAGLTLETDDWAFYEEAHARAISAMTRYLALPGVVR